MLIADDSYHEPREISCRILLGSVTYPRRRELRERRRRDRPEICVPVEPIVVPRRLPEPRQWLEQVYRLCAEGQIDAALDLVLDELDELLYESNVARCDEILAAADIDRMAVEVMLAFLMETARARAALAARAGFFRKVEAKLLLEQPQRARALLANLE